MHTHHNPVTHEDSSLIESLGLGIPFFLIALLYVITVLYTNRNYRTWPFYRTISWLLGMLCITLALVGPLAELAQTNFTAHMYTHILLGMLGPLLLAFSAPMTLLLRVLSVANARRLTRFLKSAPIRFVSHPITAIILNIGGLWLLYTTDLYRTMHTSTWIHLLVHVHVLLAGYVFTISIIYIDPAPHRTSIKLRATVLILAMAAHGILSKWIYANPPVGVTKADAEQGAMTMYYGGDAVDVLLVFLLCYQVYKATRPHHGEKGLIKV